MKGLPEKIKKGRGTFFYGNRHLLTEEANFGMSIAILCLIIDVWKDSDKSKLKLGIQTFIQSSSRGNDRKNKHQTLNEKFYSKLILLNYIILILRFIIALIFYFDRVNR